MLPQSSKRIPKVDDITTGRDEMSEVISLKEGITEILDRGGLHVKGFVTSG